MMTYDDLKNQRKDRETVQISLENFFCLINARLRYLERQNDHLIESMQNLDLSLQSGLKALYLYQGAKRYVDAEETELARLKK